jgi:hypothetical protein
MLLGVTSVILIDRTPLLAGDTAKSYWSRPRNGVPHHSGTRQQLVQLDYLDIPPHVQCAFQGLNQIVLNHTVGSELRGLASRSDSCIIQNEGSITRTDQVLHFKN